jgi:hypothetical protein
MPKHPSQRLRAVVFAAFCFSFFSFFEKADAQNCVPPTGIKIASALADRFAIEWDKNSVAATSKIRVSAAIYPTSDYFFVDFDASKGSGELTGLQRETQYLVRVNTVCGSSLSVSLGLGNVRTLSAAAENHQTGSSKSGGPFWNILDKSS